MQPLSIGQPDTQQPLHNLFYVWLVPCGDHLLVAYVDGAHGDEHLAEGHDGHNGDHWDCLTESSAPSLLSRLKDA